MKFNPIFIDKIWGGNRLSLLGFDYKPLPNCGELWALSGMEGRESIVSNGFLEENSLREVLEIYMGELVGEKNYSVFGNDFPLLIKLLDTSEKLSIQVHPNDRLARSRGMNNGKTEMWYVMHASPDAEVIDGFRRELTPEDYQQILSLGKIESFLHVEQPQQGDVFFIPAGRVHSLGKGLTVAEIQQSSDCTYRIYDYDRVDADGRKRQLHIDEALEAIDFSATTQAKTDYSYSLNATSKIIDSPYFTTNIISLSEPLRKDFSDLDSFVVYLCVEGVAAVKVADTICPVHAGECVLVPAVCEKVELYTNDKAKLLEVYVDPANLLADAPRRGNRKIDVFFSRSAEEEA